MREDLKEVLDKMVEAANVATPSWAVVDMANEDTGRVLSALESAPEHLDAQIHVRINGDEYTLAVEEETAIAVKDMLDGCLEMQLERAEHVAGADADASDED